MASRFQSDLVVKETAILNWTIVDYVRLGINDVEDSRYFSSSYSDFKFRMHLNAEVNFKICFSSNKNDVQIQCRISFLDDLKKKQHTKEYRLICGEDYNFTQSIDYIDYSEWRMTSNSDNLRIYCEVDVLERNRNIQNRTEKVLVEKNYLEGMQALLENGDFSDVVLVVGGKDFKAHKNILSVRSDVFKTMFSTDLEEKKRNRVVITDISVQVFEHLLLYIYTDIIPELSEHAVDLLNAADKYNLPYLKLTCEQHLGAEPEVESAAYVFLIADLHNAQHLKTKYIQFINENSAEVRKTEGWTLLVKARPDLMMELYQDISEKFGKMKVKN